MQTRTAPAGRHLTYRRERQACCSTWLAHAGRRLITDDRSHAMTALTPLQIRAAATLDDHGAGSAIGPTGPCHHAGAAAPAAGSSCSSTANRWLACVDGAIAGYLACQRYVTLYLAPGLNITALVVASAPAARASAAACPRRRLCPPAPVGVPARQPGQPHGAAHHFYSPRRFCAQYDQSTLCAILTDSAAP